MVLPTDREHVLATAEQIAKEPELGSGWPRIATRTSGDARTPHAVQLGQASRGELSQTIKVCEVPPRSFDLGIEVDGHAAILNAVPV